MTYPNILPLDPGRDGWTIGYRTLHDRVLFLCGLRPDRNMIRANGSPTYRWSLPSRHIIPDHTLTEEARSFRKREMKLPRPRKPATK